MPEQDDFSIQNSPKQNILQPLKHRPLSRSPHPYRRQRAEVPHATLIPRATFPSTPSPLHSGQRTEDEFSGEGYDSYSRDIRSARSTESDSGTEADDEHFLKGLPAPKWRPHKGLRGRDGKFSGSPSPLVSPAILNEEGGAVSDYLKKDARLLHQADEEAQEKFRKKRRTELGRRTVEVALLVLVGAIVMSRRDVALEVRTWKREIFCLAIISTALILLYPLRVFLHFTSEQNFGGRFQLSIPVSFDPAPILYPPALTIFAASLLSVSNPVVLLPATILSISSLPIELIPKFFDFQSSYTLHWLLSCLPLLISESDQSSNLLSMQGLSSALDREVLIMLYPLHQALCTTLYYLTTTSLLRAELQLLSITLIHLLIMASSPQTIILKAILWGGGVGTLITCSNVLRWGLTLARVPRWRFRRETRRDKQSLSFDMKLDVNPPLIRKLKDFLSFGSGTMDNSSDEDDFPIVQFPRKPYGIKIDSHNLGSTTDKDDRTGGSWSAIERKREDILPVSNSSVKRTQDVPLTATRQRRHTLPDIGQRILRSTKRTPSGRRKKSASSSLHSLFLLTERQAIMLKWLYAGYVYTCMAFIILMGIRPYVGNYALYGNEPIGWALGYLFGNLPWFRMEVVTANLERWICLPTRDPQADVASCSLGWVEHLRQATFGPANVRLVLCGYWLAIIIVGLAIVFRLSAIYEVDTRRKVFHFMMVGMLLPATYVDPTFAALALSLVLAIFLILDLLRASQLPPLSKPLAYFLTPYVDGRDLRGPVVISHIFLLIGSAIPLWLSLGALSRTGTWPWEGWEVPTRDVSMVSGVICVGMGDSAASLIGRRYGRHKWFWGGGKSIEGSLAFATAVTMALLLAKVWLRLGGWPTGGNDDIWAVTLGKTTIAASLASVTEAVLTGGNDNVVVPVVLWLCVKGLDI